MTAYLQQTAQHARSCVNICPSILFLFIFVQSWNFVGATEYQKEGYGD